MSAIVTRISLSVVGSADLLRTLTESSYMNHVSSDRAWVVQEEALKMLLTVVE